MVGISAMSWCPISTKNCTDIFVKSKSNNSPNVRLYVAQQICRPTSATAVYANPLNGEFFPEKEPSNLALRHAPFDAAERNNGMEPKRERKSPSPFN